ncbi:MAG: UDP-N-acetylmuramoyl-tripeptide--D-alanyl-D-alanine ligase [Desulfuromonas sp.]|uniref:UDP-N-acetylmuramoyl-tripeptide--D-alanyl-D- alanine ligase n=1 Tax=Desulfuromonas sp. TaxID=892 RepID=UPI000CB4C677|nr:UDP-N-acetylmuramoyl-tripeptide--D-alanyl-D-alanine ligase [Desulfuromonas sp.]PLX81651.1 MAG: UDP-N-acetylmuramoyl-tripeptide--D-alanyl-D-alanine ligase [Desulfuromonas sp.]
MNLDLQRIARLTRGRISPADASGPVAGISTDSRTLRPGELFIPLRGPNFDGHDFLVRALRNGAAACLSEDVIAGLPVPVIQVDDTLAALGDLAGGLRGDFSGPVVGVTGSAGKTTTKEMLAEILSLTGPGLKTEGNFNNLIGLPLTLLRLEPEHRWAVLEMGMSVRGEIARLAEIATPAVGVVTNVGPVHLESLHSLDGVARAKGELFAALQPGGTAVINADDDRVRQLPVANGVRRLLFGQTSEAEVRAEDVVASSGKISFRLVLPGGEWPVAISGAGRFNVQNALAAAAAAVALEIDGATIAKGLERFQTLRGRMELIRLDGDVLLLEDSYNANPLAVEAALTTLQELGGEGRRIAVLGDMLELGEDAPSLHREVGRAAARLVDRLVLLGPLGAEVGAGAREAGMPGDRVRVTASHGEAAVYLQGLLRPGDRILVKGSRGMQMEKISTALQEAVAARAMGHS